MHARRDALAAGAGLAIAATSGCLDLLLGDGLSFEATAPSVSEEALDATGYEEHRIQDHTLERTFEAAGESRDVTVTNWQAEYDRAVDLGGLGLPIDEARQQAAVFSAITTPQVEVLDQEFNPVAEMSAADIVAMAQERYEGFQDLQRVGEETVTLLGEETTATEFEGEARLTDADVRLDLTLYVVEAVPSGDDYALAIAGYPSLLESQEGDNVFTLFDGVQHDG